MRIFLLLTILLLAACSHTEQSFEPPSNTASDNGTAIIETDPEETNTEQDNEVDSAQQTDDTSEEYDEDPFFAQVDYDIEQILQELARRVAEYPSYMGKVEKTLTTYTTDLEERKSYTLYYEIETDGEVVPNEYAMHYLMYEESDSSDDIFTREGYHFTNTTSYEMTQNNDEKPYWYSFDLMEQMQSDFYAPAFYITPQELFTSLLEIKDAGHISTHNKEQGYMEISFDLTPDDHLNYMDTLLLDSFDRYTLFFGDQIYNFKQDTTAYIHMMINTNTILPNALTLGFEMDSVEVDGEIEMFASHAFDFDSYVEEIILPEEIIYMAE